MLLPCFRRSKLLNHPKHTFKKNLSLWDILISPVQRQLYKHPDTSNISVLEKQQQYIIIYQQSTGAGRSRQQTAKATLK